MSDEASFIQKQHAEALVVSYDDVWRCMDEISKKVSVMRDIAHKNNARVARGHGLAELINNEAVAVSEMLFRALAEGRERLKHLSPKSGPENEFPVKP